MSSKKQVVVIGASYRGMHCFIKNIMAQHGNDYEIAGICDISFEKVMDLNDYLTSSFKAYTDVDKMLTDIKPDIAVIANIDCVHVDYLEKTLAAGVRTVVEKPLCIDAEQCKRVRSAAAANPDIEAVTAHNLRYCPFALKMKEVLDSGRIGEIRSINFTEMLDIDHGASYFHRWNRTMKASGGLLIHKSSHHFDLMNWFTGAYAEEVSAHGSLLAYGTDNCPFESSEIAANCHNCSKSKDECRYKSDLGNGVRYQMHKRNLKHGYYTPDLCVFSPEIDIMDHIGVGITYTNGVHACYTLCAHSAVESMRIEIEGTIARLEYEIIYNAPANVSKSLGDSGEHASSLKIAEYGKAYEDIKIPKVKGGHGGADVLMCRDLFGDSNSNAKASLEDGVQAVLIGVAANESMQQGKVVRVQDLAPNK